MTRNIVALVFRCEYSGAPASSTDEAAEIAWLTTDDIADRMDEAYALRLLDALHEGPPSIRAHDGVSVVS